MIRTEYAVNVVGKFIREFGMEFLANKIVEIGERHSNNEKLSDKDKIIIGLRYYEFICDNTSDDEYCRASDLMEKIRNKFAIDYDKLRLDCKALGWN